MSYRKSLHDGRTRRASGLRFDDAGGGARPGLTCAGGAYGEPTRICAITPIEEILDGVAEIADCATSGEGIARVGIDVRWASWVGRCGDRFRCRSRSGTRRGRRGWRRSWGWRWRRSGIDFEVVEARGARSVHALTCARTDLHYHVVNGELTRKSVP